MNPEEPNKTKVESAVANRLAAFGQREVDTSRLEERIRAALDEEIADPSISGKQMDHDASPIARLTWLRPVMGLAAMIAVAAALLFAFNFNPPNATAAAVELSELHEDIASGQLNLKPYATIEDANRGIIDQVANTQVLPDELENARVQSCCLTDVQGELAALALLQIKDTPVTLVVARAANFGAHGEGHQFEIDGRMFHGHEKSGIPMMMANREDRWLCVMGHLDYQQLAEIAAKIDF